MKRFYKQASVTAMDSGFAVQLDGRTVKTPARNDLRVPSRALAEAIAAEWNAQGEEVQPLSMPFLRLADTVIDGIAPDPAPVAAAVLRFGENDLICYRADNPPDLARLQAEGWDPLLEWVRHHCGAALIATSGFGHVEQPAESLAALKARIDAFDPYGLAALHVVASITGSLVLALALGEGYRNPAQVFALSRIDEGYQIGKWGEDHEAQVRATNLARELDNAYGFLIATR